MRILIVDSREIVRLGLKKIVAKLWIWAEVCEVNDLNAAVEKIAIMNYDLLLINADIGNQGELLSIIRLLLEETKVVVLTDQENNYDGGLRQLIIAGVDTVVPMKNADLNQFKEKLSNLF